MDSDDLPPPAPGSDDATFGGQLGLIFAGAAWVAVFTAIAGAILWAMIRWS